jgi:hypothetical protein
MICTYGVNHDEHDVWLAGNGTIAWQLRDRDPGTGAQKQA